MVLHFGACVLVMRRNLFIFWILWCSLLQSEVIDRTLAIVNNHLVTLSDVRREREIRAVMGMQESKDDSTILKELVDDQIVQEQIAQFPGVEVTDAQIDMALRGYTDLRGVPLVVMREAIARRLRTAEFIELRFQPFIQATDDEIRAYYENIFVPEAEKRGLSPVPTLEQTKEALRENVVQEKVKHEVDNWMEANRRRSDIEIFQ